MADDHDYEVGYGKPPKHSRFKPGQSGNPRGRKKGARGLKTDLAAELSTKHTIQINKKLITATTQRLMIKTLATRAASGDVKAAQVLLPLIVQILGIEDRGGKRQALSAQDQSILDDMLGAEPSLTDIVDQSEEDANHSQDEDDA
jgi:Family of unknown function (DUF5681)